MKSSLILSISASVCFVFVLSLCLNHITWLSLCACCLCLLCRYPLAPSHFDKLGHENKPPQCQENAKYRASFLWQCLFNQLPLISALHPLFSLFSERNGGEICTPPTSSPLNTPPHPPLPPPSSLACSFVRRCVPRALPQSPSFCLPPSLFSAMLYLFLSHLLILPWLCRSRPLSISLMTRCLSSTLRLIPLCPPVPGFPVLFHTSFSSLACASAIVLLPS